MIYSGRSPGAELGSSGGNLHGIDFNSGEGMPAYLVSLPYPPPTGVGGKVGRSMGGDSMAGTCVGCRAEPEAIRRLCDLNQSKPQFPHLQTRVIILLCVFAMKDQ